MIVTLGHWASDVDTEPRLAGDDANDRESRPSLVHWSPNVVKEDIMRFLKHLTFARLGLLGVAVLSPLAAQQVLGAAPGSTEVICDVDRSRFQSLSRGATQVIVQLWDAASGGAQCGAHAVPLAQVEATRVRTQALFGVPARTFLRLRTVIGTDSAASALCADPETWIDIIVGGATIGCDLAERRRLQSVPYARSSDDQNATAPSGAVLPFGGSTAPHGWLRCDGAAVSRTIYARLFAVLGTAYGDGDGVSTFNLPDLRGRVPVGMGLNDDVDTIGDNDGQPLQARSPRHSHTVAAHNHTVNAHTHGVNIWSGVEFAVGFDPSRRYPKNDFDNFSHRHAINGDTDPASPTTSTAPASATDAKAPSYVVTSYIIKY